MPDYLLGQTTEFWMKLRDRFEKEEGPDAVALLEENVALRGKVSFYESRIAQMAAIMGPVR